MRSPARILLIGLSLCLMLCVPEVARAAPQVLPQILEPGLRVTHYDQCGYGGRPRDARYIPPYTEPARARIDDMVCSPGAVWGDAVFLSVDRLNSEFEPFGQIERVRFNGKSEVIDSTASWDMISSLSFAPEGWRGGDLLIASSPPGHSPPVAGLSGMDPSGTWTGIASRFGAFIGPSAVDPSGAFGSDLFFQARESPGGGLPPWPPYPAGIYRIDAAGVESRWRDL